MQTLTGYMAIPEQNSDKKVKENLFTIICFTFILIGVSLIVYYFVCGYISAVVQSRAINTYTANVSRMGIDSQTSLLTEAQVYNESLVGNPGRFWVTADDTAKYNALLNVDGSGVMCYLYIPKLNIRVPVYHGTDSATLGKGIGHVEGSSLPVGGSGAHAIIAGHRGDPSAHYFEHLDKLSIGDRFTISVLGKTLIYEVDQILVIEPNDYSALQIVPGEDYVTLMTCTPYGSDTNRLIVRGHRVS